MNHDLFRLPLLFIILCVIMFLTKNLKMDAPNRPAEPN